MPDISAWTSLLTQPGQMVGPDIGKIISAQQLAQQMQQKQRVMQGYNAVGALYADPNNVDERGYLKPDVQRQLIANAPEVGLEVQAQQLTTAHKQAQIALESGKIRDAEKARLLDDSVPLYTKASGLMAKGLDEATVNQMMQPDHDAFRKASQASGNFPTLGAQIPADFSFSRLQGNLLGHKGALQAIEKEPERALARKADARAEIASNTAQLNFARGESTEPKAYEVPDGKGGTTREMLRWDKDQKQFVNAQGVVREPLRPVAGEKAEPTILHAKTTDGKTVNVERDPSGNLIDSVSKKVIPPEAIVPGSLQKIGSGSESTEPKAYEVPDGKGGTTREMLRWDKDQKQFVNLQGVVREPLRLVAGEKGEEKIFRAETIDGKPLDLKMDPNGNYVDAFSKEQIKPEDIKRGSITALPPGSSGSSEAINAIAEPTAAYKLAPLSPRAMAAGNGPAVMKAIKEINPDYDATKYNAANRTRVSFAGDGRNAKTLTALNTVTQHLGVFDELAEGLKNKDTNVFNRVINYVKSEIGRPEVTDFNTAKAIIADEVVNAVAGTGAVFDRKGMQEQLSSSRSPEQLIGQVDKIKRLMAGRVDGLQKLWTSNGLPQSEFYEHLLPDTLSAVEKYMAKGSRPSDAAGSAKGAAVAPLAAPLAVTETSPPRAADGSYMIRPGPQGAKDWEAIPSGAKFTAPNGSGIKP